MRLVVLLVCFSALQAVEPVEGWVVRISRLAATSRVQFDQNRPPRFHESLTVSLEIEHPADVQAIRHHGLVLEHLTTDVGVISLPSINQQTARRMPDGEPIRSVSGRPSRLFSLQTNLALLPPAGATIIRELRGSIAVDVADGQALEVRLTPIGELLNRPLIIEGQDDLTILILGLDPLQVRVPVLWSHIRHDMSALDGQGQTIPYQGWSGGDDQSFATTTYQITVPADGAVIIPLPPPTRQILLPVVATDLPLPRLSGTVPETAPPQPVVAPETGVADF